jgi:hypothetical protein
LNYTACAAERLFKTIAAEIFVEEKLVLLTMYLPVLTFTNYIISQARGLLLLLIKLFPAWLA